MSATWTRCPTCTTWISHEDTTSSPPLTSPDPACASPCTPPRALLPGFASFCDALEGKTNITRVPARWYTLFCLVSSRGGYNTCLQDEDEWLAMLAICGMTNTVARNAYTNNLLALEKEQVKHLQSLINDLGKKWTPRMTMISSTSGGGSSATEEITATTQQPSPSPVLATPTIPLTTRKRASTVATPPTIINATTTTAPTTVPALPPTTQPSTVPLMTRMAQAYTDDFRYIVPCGECRGCNVEKDCGKCRTCIKLSTLKGAALAQVANEICDDRACTSHILVPAVFVLPPPTHQGPAPLPDPSWIPFTTRVPRPPLKLDPWLNALLVGMLWNDNLLVPDYRGDVRDEYCNECRADIRMTRFVVNCSSCPAVRCESCSDGDDTFISRLVSKSLWLCRDCLREGALGGSVSQTTIPPQLPPGAHAPAPYKLCGTCGMNGVLLSDLGLVCDGCGEYTCSDCLLVNAPRHTSTCLDERLCFQCRVWPPRLNRGVATRMKFDESTPGIATGKRLRIMGEWFA